MNTLLISLTGILGLFFLWGLFSPRTQWHALVGWTRSDPRASEPGSGAYSAGRFLSLIGLLSVMTIAVSWSVGAISVAQDGSSRPLTLIERVWGEPRSYVVDRVFAPLSLAPEGLVEHKVTGYQIVDGVAKRPQYLFDLGKIREAGLATQPGFLGVVPLAGTVALETADFVVNVSGDDRCIPQQVVVLDGADSVQIAVYFGQPKLPDGSPAPEAADCDADAPVENRRGFLIPVDIAEPLDDRQLQSLDGTPVELVPLPSS